MKVTYGEFVKEADKLESSMVDSIEHSREIIKEILGEQIKEFNLMGYEGDDYLRFKLISKELLEENLHKNSGRFLEDGIAVFKETIDDIHKVHKEFLDLVVTLKNATKGDEEKEAIETYKGYKDDIVEIFKKLSHYDNILCTTYMTFKYTIELTKERSKQNEKNR